MFLLSPPKPYNRRDAGTATSTVSLTGVSALTEIGSDAFRKFYGSRELRGSCPNLRIIGETAFLGRYGIGGISQVELRDLESLTEIGEGVRTILDGCGCDLKTNVRSTRF